MFLKFPSASLSFKIVKGVGEEEREMLIKGYKVAVM